MPSAENHLEKGAEIVASWRIAPELDVCLIRSVYNGECFLVDERMRSCLGTFISHTMLGA